MSGSAVRSRAVERIERLCASVPDERTLRARILDELRRWMRFDAYVWLLTDPATAVGSSPLADVPSTAPLPAFVKDKYLNPVNRWTALRGAGGPVGLWSRSAADPANPWWALLAGQGVSDVASAVFSDRHGCWGMVDLWRTDGDRFTEADAALLADAAGVVTTALRRRAAATFGDKSPLAGPPGAAPAGEAGPPVLLLDEDLTIGGRTAAAERWLRRLLPTAPGVPPIPAAAYNVAAQLLATEAGVDTAPASARSHVPGLTWVTLRASRLTRTGRPGAAIAVSIELTPAGERLDLYGRSHAFTARERDLLRALARGLDTRELASRMGIHRYTVQDHLKSIFAKTGLGTRNAVVSAALGADR